MLVAALLVLAGLVLLVAGAEWLVRGASGLALALGISPLVVGLTVVAFGTSAPELVVSVRAALLGAGGVAIGNVVGSNIFNTLAILGVAALSGGLVVHRRIVRLEVPLLLVVTAAVWWLVADGAVGRGEGIGLVIGVLVYTVLAYRIGQTEPAGGEVAAGTASASSPRRGRAAGLVVVGLLGLVVGAQLLVTGATTLAERLGVPELIIGLTLVAAGTSLPELATSVVAARRGQRDIAVGNVVGSNLFNLLAVLGAAALAGGGIAVPRDAVITDLPVTLLVTVAVLPALATGLVVRAWEGGLLLAAYAGYVGLLALVAIDSPARAGARLGLLAGLAGLAVVFVAVGLAARRRSPPSPSA